MNTLKVTQYIVDWLKQYAINSGLEGFVIGISGGIDSAVTSTLCAKTNLPTLCVKLPIYQSKNQVARANEHIKQLKEKYKLVDEIKIDLTSTFENFKNVTPKIKQKEKLNLSLANTRSRLRMCALYYLAGINNLLVVGTGNKIEDFGVGFYTKYGDGGVDISPIADLLKSEIYEIAKYLKVPLSIQTAKPTDGLFDDSRSDEDQIGASYDELEWAMEMQKMNKKTCNFNNREKKVYKIYSHLNKINQHKMNPIPICVIPENLK